MNLWIVRIAGFVLAVISSLAGYAGMVLSLQAYEFLIDSFRFNAVLMVGLVSAVLFLASYLLASGRRGGLVVALASSSAMLMVIAFGLSHMGGETLVKGLQQAFCVPGSALCFNQAVTVVRLCELLIIGCIALAGFRYFLPIHDTQKSIQVKTAT